MEFFTTRNEPGWEKDPGYHVSATPFAVTGPCALPYHGEEPKPCMDREILHGDPHELVEGYLGPGCATKAS